MGRKGREPGARVASGQAPQEPEGEGEGHGSEEDPAEEAGNDGAGEGFQDGVEGHRSQDGHCQAGSSQDDAGAPEDERLTSGPLGLRVRGPGPIGAGSSVSTLRSGAPCLGE